MSEQAVRLDYALLPALAASRKQSLALVELVSSRLAAALGDGGDVLTVAAAGSLGRLELGAGSDLDGIVVVDAHAAARGTALVDRVYAALRDCPLRLPKTSGIFRSPVTEAALCAPAARGALDEQPAIFGKRIQFLLDTRPLFGMPAYSTLQRRILDWYAGPGLAAHPASQCTLLINDLQRYLHAYAGWQQYKFERDADDGWYLRQAKLRASRALTFAGLLLLLGAGSRREDKVDWLHAHLALTPLERVHAVMSEHDPTGFRDLAQDYDRVHALLTDPAVRAELIERSPGSAEMMPSQHPPAFAEIHRLSGGLLRRLSRFVLERRDDWHPDFFSYLIL
jgi:hypothetical protein